MPEIVQNFWTQCENVAAFEAFSISGAKISDQNFGFLQKKGHCADKGIFLSDFMTFS